MNFASKFKEGAFRADHYRTKIFDGNGDGMPGA